VRRRRLIAATLYGIGIALILEHLWLYGATWDVGLHCHGFYGLVAIVIGFLVGHRIRRDE